MLVLNVQYTVLRKNAIHAIRGGLLKVCVIRWLKRWFRRKEDKLHMYVYVEDKGFLLYPSHLCTLCEKQDERKCSFRKN